LTEQTRKADMKLIKAYERFIPQEILKMLRKEDITKVSLGNQIEKEMTVMFSDIRGFTSMSEEMTPQSNFDFINSYLSRMEPVIRHHNGIVDKYVGDAIMALFPSSVLRDVHQIISYLKAFGSFPTFGQSSMLLYTSFEWHINLLI